MPRRPEGDLKHPHLILCEGPDDVGFLSALAKHHELKPVHIRHTGATREDRGGNSKFGEKLLRLKAHPKFDDVIKHILILGDSDDDEGRSFRSIHRQIVNADHIAPVAVRQPSAGRR